MSDFWPFIIAGVTTGSLYGIAAMGLVLTYKTSGIFNFAHGAVAAAGAYVFYELHFQHGVPWPIAGLLVVFVAAPVMGVVLERLARGLADAPPAAKIVGTVGLLLAIQGVLVAIYGPTVINFPQFLPTRTFRIFDVNVGYDQLFSVVIAIGAAAGLFCLFRYSRAGVAMRGVVDNPDLLDLAGTSPARVRTQAWVIGSSFAAVSGILLAPSLGLDALLLTLLVVQAFGAAALGRFTSLPLTYLGGLVVGVAASLSTKFVADVPNLRGFPPSVPFMVLFGVLVFTRRGRLVEGGLKRPVRAEAEPLPAMWLRAARAGSLMAAIAVPYVVGPRLPVFTNGAIFVLIFLSLRLLVRTSGLVSLAQAAFAAVGAVTFSHLAHGAGLPWLVALLAAGLVTVPVGAIIAIPALRLSGLYLALATFGFGILVERMLFGTFLMFGQSGARPAPRPDLWNLGGDQGFYYVCLAAAVLGLVAVHGLGRSRLGRMLQALADSPVALTTHGLNVNVTRVLVFCLSAFMAGIAGGLLAALSGAVSGVGFNAFASLLWLTVFFLAGPGEVSGPVLAALFLTVVPSYIDNPNYADLQPVVFGSLALWAALSQGGRFNPFERLQRAAASRGDRVRHSPRAERWALAATRVGAAGELGGHTS